MALKVTNIERSFTFKNKDGEEITLPDPVPGMTPHQVCKFYAQQYPEITTASIEGPEYKDDKAVYIINSEAGTKG